MCQLLGVPVRNMMLTITGAFVGVLPKAIDWNVTVEPIPVVRDAAQSGAACPRIDNNKAPPDAWNSIRAIIFTHF